MATKTIDQLPSSSPLVGNEVLPIVQGNETLKTTVQDIANLAGSFKNLFIPLTVTPDGTVTINDTNYSYFIANENNLFFGNGSLLNTNIQYNPYSFYEDYDGLIHIGVSAQDIGVPA
jgi:hypothetical protein